MRLVGSTMGMIAAAAFFVAGCHGGSESGTAPETAAKGEVVATYKGRKLTSADVEAEMERLPAPSRTYLMAPERRRQFVENLITNDLLFLEGQDAGLDHDDEIERQVRDLRKRLVVQRVMRKYQTPPTITDEQVRAYYDSHPDLYSTTQIRASHILVKDQGTAEEILAELKAHPERFEEIATARSTDATSARKGGDLGMFGQGRMVPDFEQVAFSLKAGETSGVVKTQYGYHIIKVTERKDGERKPFEQVKEQIRATLRNQGLQQQVDGHLAEIKKAADVTIDDAAIARLTVPPPSPTQGVPFGGH